MSTFGRVLADARDDIFKYAKMLNFDPTHQQADLLRLVQAETFAPPQSRKKGIFTKSGQGPGKTAASVIAGSWRVLQELNEQVIVTAPTMRQVCGVWMSELSRRIAKAAPEFRRLVKVTSKKMVICGQQEWGIFTATATKSENFQGYHSPGMTVILDEASGIPRSIYETIKGTTTQEGNLILAIGNPNDRNTPFFDAFNKDYGIYHTLTWSAEDSPNVSKKHIQDMEAEFGRESDIFRVRVLGEFPRQNPNSVIRYEDLMACSKDVNFLTSFRTRNEGEEQADVRQFGIDFARFGSDESIVVARFNCAVIGMRVFSKAEPSEVVDNAFQWQKELGWKNASTSYCVDAGGMGQGVMHKFYDEGKHVFEFHSQGTSNDPTLYYDSITEAYFILRKLTRNRRLCLKFDNRMFSQLTSRVYLYRDGVFRLESKDDYLTRLKTQEECASPDRADALAMAFYPFASSSGMRISG